MTSWALDDRRSLLHKTVTDLVFGAGLWCWSLEFGVFGSDNKENRIRQHQTYNWTSKKNSTQKKVNESQRWSDDVSPHKNRDDVSGLGSEIILRSKTDFAWRSFLDLSAKVWRATKCLSLLSLFFSSLPRYLILLANPVWALVALD